MKFKFLLAALFATLACVSFANAEEGRSKADVDGARIAEYHTIFSQSGEAVKGYTAADHAASVNMEGAAAEGAKCGGGGCGKCGSCNKCGKCNKCSKCGSCNKCQSKCGKCNKCGGCNKCKKCGGCSKCGR